MTTHVFHDQGIIFYVPEDGREETYPFWSTFMRIAVSVAQMEDVRHPDAEHVQFLTSYDDRNELLGIQMPDPVLLNVRRHRRHRRHDGHRKRPTRAPHQTCRATVPRLLGPPRRFRTPRRGPRHRSSTRTG